MQFRNKHQSFYPFLLDPQISSQNDKTFDVLEKNIKLNDRLLYQYFKLSKVMLSDVQGFESSASV